MGVPINIDKFVEADLAFALIPTFARLLKNKRQMRNRGMDAAIRRIASGTR